ncbi:MAG: hypothetical protein JO089_00640 [Alphaproteobacteria bacterium]|nr:hypothetical protein [Alphaproteobacteria bacterium]
MPRTYKDLDHTERAAVEAHIRKVERAAAKTNPGWTGDMAENQKNTLRATLAGNPDALANAVRKYDGQFGLSEKTDWSGRVTGDPRQTPRKFHW